MLYRGKLSQFPKKPETPHVSLMSARHPTHSPNMPHDDSNPRPEDWLADTARQWAPHLERYAYSICRSHERAKDAVQDSFRKLSQVPQAERPDPAKPWLFRVCRNRLIDLQRKESRNVPLEEATLDTTPDESHSPRQSSEQSDLHAHVLDSIDQLPAPQREVVRLKFQNELSYKEISAITDHSVSYVGVLLHSAMRTLRERMTQLR